MWQRLDAGVIRTWDNANTYCNNLNLAGHSDWRLPTKKELLGIVIYGRYNPAIYTSVFPNTVASKYWSSTTDAHYTGRAWYVDFNNGEVFTLGIGDNLYAHCVHGGQ